MVETRSVLALIIVGAVIGVVIVLALIEAALEVEFMSEDRDGNG